jgi:sugar phosphate isomerase/epimerase
MKYGFSTLGCPDWSVEKIASEAARFGYDGVEVRGIKRVMDLSKVAECSEENADATKGLFADAGVEIVGINSSAQFCKPDGPDREAAHAEAEKHIDIAARMGAPFMRVFGGFVPEGESREKWTDELIEDLKRAGAYAADKGVTIILETHDDWTKAEHITAAVAGAGMANVRALWDLANGLDSDDSLEAAGELYKPYVAHTHVKDFDTEHNYTLIGEGIFPFEEQIRVLKRIGYEGYLSIEWEKAWHPELDEPEVAFPGAIEFLKKIVASV